MARFSLDIFLRILSFELLFQSISPPPYPLAGPMLNHPSLHSPPVSPPVHTQSEYSQKGNKLEIHAFLIAKLREKECLGLCASVLIL